VKQHQQENYQNEVGCTWQQLLDGLIWWLVFCWFIKQLGTLFAMPTTPTSIKHVFGKERGAAATIVHHFNNWPPREPPNKSHNLLA
jgi:hypothetical protein